MVESQVRSVKGKEDPPYSLGLEPFPDHLCVMIAGAIKDDTDRPGLGIDSAAE